MWPYCTALKISGYTDLFTPSHKQNEITEQEARLGGQVHREGKKTLLAYHLSLLHLEGVDVDDSDASVRQCHRYLSHRLEQLNYQRALLRDLPIGSGEIESAHRYIVQQRLKRPGAWWRAANAEHMLGPYNSIVRTGSGMRIGRRI